MEQGPPHWSERASTGPSPSDLGSSPKTSKRSRSSISPRLIVAALAAVCVIAFAVIGGLHFFNKPAGGSPGEALAQASTPALYPVGVDGKYGFVDKTGTMVIPTQYEKVGVFSDGLAPVQLNGRYGYIDRTGAMVIPLQYNDPASV